MNTAPSGQGVCGKEGEEEEEEVEEEVEEKGEVEGGRWSRRKWRRGR